MVRYSVEGPGASGGEQAAAAEGGGPLAQEGGSAHAPATKPRQTKSTITIVLLLQTVPVGCRRDKPSPLGRAFRGS